MKHAAAFTAARDALNTLLLDPARLKTDPQAVSEAMSHTAAAYLAAEGENRPAALDVPAPADPQVGAVLSTAWAALNAYTARELPAWGSAEHDALLIPLSHALTVLDVVSTVQEAAAYTAAPEPHVRLAAQFVERAQADPAPGGRLAHTLSARAELGRGLAAALGEPDTREAAALIPDLLLEHALSDIQTAAQLLAQVPSTRAITAAQHLARAAELLTPSN